MIAIRLTKDYKQGTTQLPRGTEGILIGVSPTIDDGSSYDSGLVFHPTKYPDVPYRPIGTLDVELVVGKATYEILNLPKELKF